MTASRGGNYQTARTHFCTMRPAALREMNGKNSSWNGEAEVQLAYKKIQYVKRQVDRLPSALPEGVHQNASYKAAIKNCDQLLDQAYSATSALHQLENQPEFYQSCKPRRGQPAFSEVIEPKVQRKIIIDVADKLANTCLPALEAFSQSATLNHHNEALKQTDSVKVLTREESVQQTRRTMSQLLHTKKDLQNMMWPTLSIITEAPEGTDRYYNATSANTGVTSNDFGANHGLSINPVSGNKARDEVGNPGNGILINNTQHRAKQELPVLSSTSETPLTTGTLEHTNKTSNASSDKVPEYECGVGLSEAALRSIEYQGVQETARSNMPVIRKDVKLTERYLKTILAAKRSGVEIDLDVVDECNAAKNQLFNALSANKEGFSKTGQDADKLNTRLITAAANFAERCIDGLRVAYPELFSSVAEAGLAQFVRPKRARQDKIEIQHAMKDLKSLDNVVIDLKFGTHRAALNPPASAPSVPVHRQTVAPSRPQSQAFVPPSKPSDAYWSNNAPQGRWSIQTSAGHLQIHQDNSVVNLQLNANDMDHFRSQGVGADSVTKKITNAIYEVFSDDFDFIFFVNGNEYNRADGLKYAGRHIGVKQDVSGIGKSKYDSSHDYGSAGKLQGIIHFTDYQSVRSGPFLHEIAHQWANHYYETTKGGHFGNACVGGEYGCQLGGCSLDTMQDLGDNTYKLNSGREGWTSFGPIANGANGVPYCDTELYLMGYVPASQVPDTMHFSGLTSSGPWNDKTYHSTSVRSYSIDDMVSQHGERVPDHNESQKDFSGIVVVLSDSQLSDAQWRRVVDDVEFMGDSQGKKDASGNYNFVEATKGLGTLKLNGLRDARRAV